MASASAGLAEVYVMKKLHKDKMKRMDDLQINGKVVYAIDSPDDDQQINRSVGCLSSIFKKIHPANINIKPAHSDSAEKTGSKNTTS